MIPELFKSAWRKASSHIITVPKWALELKRIDKVSGTPPRHLCVLVHWTLERLWLLGSANKGTAKALHGRLAGGG